MSTVSVTQAHNKDVAEIREQLEAVAAKLEARYQLVPQWRDDHHLELSRQGLQCNLEFDEREVRVTIKLGLMMSAFKSKIRDEVARALRERLG